jgi:putative ABC transport system permease protein
MRSTRVSTGARVFRALLRLLPGDFRGDFGSAMSADAAIGANWWTREIPGLLIAIVREHADVLRHDLKYALRMMRRTPGFTLIAMLMLGLGTGVNVAMFSVVDAVMIRSPFKNANRLAMVRVAETDGRRSAVPLDRLRDLEASPAIDRLAILTGGSHVLTGVGDPKPMDNVECVSAPMFDVLGTAPLLGRTFDAADDQPGASPTLVLSYTMWKQLGGSAAMLGAPLTINQTPVTVIGVMPRGFYGAQSRANTQAWFPYHRPIRSTDNAGCRTSATTTVVARVRAGLSLGQAAERAPGFAFEVLESVWMDAYRTPLFVLSGAVACVLLIACFNVGGLQMERTLARRRELSLRLALGAGRARIIRQVFTENLAFALSGGVTGTIAAAVAMKALISLLPPNLPYIAEIAVNSRALLITLLVAAGAGLICGVFPILEMRRFSAGASMDGSRTTTPAGGWIRRSLVIAEIGLSIVVMIGAGLMIETFLTLRPDRPGFEPDHKLWQPVRLRGATPEASADFYGRLFEKLRGAPGIAGVSGTNYVPMIRLSGEAQFIVEGTPRRAYMNEVTPGHFALMKIPIVAGRDFSSQDTRGAELVIIVNETAARRIRPDGRVVGERVLMKLDGIGIPGPPSERTIVGVIANTRGNGNNTLPAGEAYLPFAQNPRPNLTLVIDYLPGRSAEAASSVRAALRELKPDLVVAAPSDLRDMIDKEVATPRFSAWLLGLFAGLALLLASIGLMTTIGWWVNQRTRELGVRMALGASRVQITRLVCAQGLLLAAIGVMAGCGTAAALTRYMTSFIYGVTPLDAATFAACAAVMLLVALVAIFFPTRRATRVDPVIALRAE